MSSIYNTLYYSANYDRLTYGYDKDNNRIVHQYLESVSKYDLEGDFGSIIKRLEATFAYYKRENTDVAAQYLGDSKSTKKTLLFTDFFLDWRKDAYEDSESLCIIGERKPDAQEEAAWDKLEQEQQAKTKERKLQEYERLKKEFEGK